MFKPLRIGVHLPPDGGGRPTTSTEPPCCRRRRPHLDAGGRERRRRDHGAWVVAVLETRLNSLEKESRSFVFAFVCYSGGGYNIYAIEKMNGAVAGRRRGP